MSADPIETALDAGTKRASDDSGSFENYDLSDMVEADKYLKNKAAGAANPFAQTKRARAIAAGPVQ